jgi:hypothetical protein
VNTCVVSYYHRRGRNTKFPTYSGIGVWGKGEAARESNFACMIPRCVFFMTIEDIEAPELSLDHDSSEDELKEPILNPHLHES